MQAVILAAGMGKRLKEYTKDNTKCMVKVNDTTLIDRMLHQLDKRGLTSIIVVIGYEGIKLRKHIDSLCIHTPVMYISNDMYDKTNNIYSLYLAKDYLMKEDTLLFESDIIFEDEILDVLIDEDSDTCALVEKYKPWMDGTCVKLNENDDIVEVISGNGFIFDESSFYYKTVNIYKFGKDFSKNVYVPFLEAYLTALGRNEYYEQVLKVIASLDKHVIKGKRLNGQKWYEIDDKQDLDIAEAIFSSNVEDRVMRMEERYGGYWRFPELLDYCYLVNPYYPPQRLKDEMKASFDTLVTRYPSGMKINTLLVSKNFNVKEDSIVVGNGAAELIRSIINNLKGNMGIIRPTFEEYPNRYDNKKIIEFISSKEDYKYAVDDVMDYFNNKAINFLVIINPDNPTGNYIKKDDMMRLLSWSREKDIRLIIDESFADFAEEENNTFLNQFILDNNPQLFVIKSISKSYGVPGLRLGILASSDKSMIEKIKKDVSIWNINSFAEFFLQIQGKYDKSYYFALSEFMEERRRFESDLSGIKCLKVVPSQANYFMIKLLSSMNAKELTKRLLNDYNILVKDLTEKVGNKYIRIAVRDRIDNKKITEALSAILK